jgi:hypothetical protein
MAKSAASPEARDRALAERLRLSRKRLKKAVREETIRLVAERIAEEQVDSAWQEIAALEKRHQKED